MSNHITLDQVIHELQEIKRKVGDGTIPVIPSGDAIREAITDHIGDDEEFHIDGIIETGTSVNDAEYAPVVLLHTEISTRD